MTLITDQVTLPLQPASSMLRDFMKIITTRWQEKQLRMDHDTDSLRLTSLLHCREAIGVSPPQAPSPLDYRHADG